MRAHPRRKARAVAYAFDDARDVGGAVELGHFARHGDVGVDEGLVVDNHVLVWLGRVGGFLEAVGLSAKEVLPAGLLDEVKEGDDCEGPGLGARGFAEEEEVEEFEAY